MICIMPNCTKEIPKWRLKSKMPRVTCSKKCSGEWNHMSSKDREKIRGKPYNKKLPSNGRNF